jgi:Zn-dependent protease/predicted transcriptional regulator
MGIIMGIPIYFHFTFLFIIPIFAAIFAFNAGSIFGIVLGYYGLNASLFAKILLGAICAMLFFFTILLHELGHSYVALKHGYSIRSITLLIFGGVAQMEDTPKEPAVEAWMSFVGPGVSFLVGLILTPIYFVIEGVRNPGVGLQAFQITCGILGFYNLLLGAFNLVPAFPMDGGRILRSFLAKRMGMLKGTEIAVKTGRIIAIGMVAVGIITFEVFVVFIGFFIYVGASEEESMTRFAVALEGIKVKDIMDPEVFWVAPSMTLNQVLDRMIQEHRTTFPVVEDSTLVGVVSAAQIDRVPEAQRDGVTAGNVADRTPAHVRNYVDATEVLKALSDRRDFIVVLDERNEFVGSITKDELHRIVTVLDVKKNL